MIGAALLFHSGKVNSKLPAAQTQVIIYHDFLFPPMSNGDMFSSPMFIADGIEYNGPLEVFPGTHKGPLYSLWHNGFLTGSVSDVVLAIHKYETV